MVRETCRDRVVIELPCDPFRWAQLKEHRGSPRSIDLGICAVGAYDRATYHAAQPATTFRSNYETEGLTFAGR